MNPEPIMTQEKAARDSEAAASREAERKSHEAGVQAQTRANQQTHTNAGVAPGSVVGGPTPLADGTMPRQPGVVLPGNTQSTAVNPANVANPNAAVPVAPKSNASAPNLNTGTATNQ